MHSSTFVPKYATSFEVNSSENEEEMVPWLHATQTGEFIKDLFQFTYIDVMHSYSMKKHVPSARGVYPYFPLIYYRNYLFLYDASSDEFHYVGKKERKEPTIRILFCLDVWRTSSIYGQFGFVLCLLELGHLIAHSSVYLERTKGLTKVADAMDLKWMDQHGEQYSIKNASDTLVMYELELNEENNKVATTCTKKVELKKRYNYKKEIKHIHLQDTFLPLNRIEYSPLNSAEKGMFESRKYRHSNNLSFGTYSIGKPLQKESWDVFIQSLYLLKKRHCLEHITIYLVVQSVEGVKQGLYQIKEDALLLLDEPVDVTSIFYEGKEQINMDLASFIMLVSVHDVDINDHEQFIIDHVHVGELIHYSSLLFAGKNRFTRPIKNVNDAYCRELLSLNQQTFITYGCIFGVCKHPIYLPWR